MSICNLPQRYLKRTDHMTTWVKFADAHERKKGFHDIVQTYLQMDVSEKPPHGSIKTVSITSLLL